MEKNIGFEKIIWIVLKKNRNLINKFKDLKQIIKLKLDIKIIL